MPKAVGQYTIVDLSDITSSTTAPSSPTANQLWLDISITPNVIKRYTGTIWVPAGIIPGDIPVYQNDTLQVRYIRDWINGNTVNTGNHWVEIKAMSGSTNIASGKTASLYDSANNIIAWATPGTRVTDGDTASANYDTGTPNTGKQYVKIDLGAVYDNIGYIHVWHFHSDGRSYLENKTEVSSDGVTWITLHDTAVTGTYKETTDGHAVVVNGSGQIGKVSDQIANWIEPGTSFIDGGKIYADSVTADKLFIGARGISVEGLEFSAQMDPSNSTITANKVFWTGGTIYYVNDAGSMSSAVIATGSYAWTTGTVYLYWTKGSTSITTATTCPANAVIMATYKGGADLVVLQGRTTIDGTDIVTGSLTADRLKTSTLSASTSITVGSMLLDGAGSLRSGQTAFDTGIGFWLGSTGTPKFSIGNSAGNKITWDGTTLNVTGNISLTNTLSADKLTEGSTNKVFNSSLQIGGRNYLKNASCEQFSGGFTGWTLFGNADAAVTTQATDAPTSIYGTKSAKFSIASPAAGGSVSNVQWGQLVNISNGKEYTVSFWAKSSVPMSNKIVSVHLTSSPWTNYGLSYSLNLTTTWQFFTKTFTANTSDISARLNFQVGGVAGDVYIDNVKFEDGNKNTAFTLANEDIDTYGTTATWSGVNGTGKPADNATVGASWGTNLGNIPTTLTTPSTSGLYLSSTNMGFYSGGVWKTSIDSAGNLKLGDDLTNFTTAGLKGLQWDQANGVLKIRGQILADDISAGTISANRIGAATISADKLSGGIIAASKQILVGGVTIDSGDGSTTGSIRVGKANADSLAEGFWLGKSGSITKFAIGNSLQYMKWDGTKLIITGDISGTGNYKWLVRRYPNAPIAAGGVPGQDMLKGRTSYYSYELSNNTNPVAVLAPAGTTGTFHISTNIYMKQAASQQINISCNRPCSYYFDGVEQLTWPQGITGSAFVDVIGTIGWHTIDFYFNDEQTDGSGLLTINTDLLVNTDITNLKAYPVDAPSNIAFNKLVSNVISKGAGGKRQCVLNGALDSYGTPDLIEYTTGVVGTTIPSISRTYNMNISPLNPVTITFADGFSKDGPVDYAVMATKEPSSQLEISSIETSYIFSELLDIFNKELAVGYTTVKPIYSEKMQDASTVLLTGTDLTPYAWASDGTQTNTSYSTNTPDKAFDGNTGTYWAAYKTMDLLGAGAGIGAKLNSKMRIRKLRYTMSGTTGNNPSRIYFQYMDLPEGQTPNGDNWLDTPDMAVLEMEQTDVNGEYTFDIPDYPGGNWFKIGFWSGSYSSSNRWAVPEIQVWATKEDQHWFDLKEWRMKVYNSNTTSGWDYKKRVFIGEDEWRINSSGTTTVSALLGATTITATMSAGLSLFSIPPRPISKDLFVVIESGSNRHVTYLDWVSGSTYKLADALPFALPSGSKVTQYENVDTFTYAYGGRWSSGEFRVKGGKTYDFKHKIGTDNVIVSKLERQDPTYQWAKDTKVYNGAYFGGSINFDSSYLSLYYKTNVGHADTHGAGSFAASAQTKGEAQIIAERSF